MERFLESVGLVLSESGIGFGQVSEHSLGWANYMFLLRSRNESFMRALNSCLGGVLALMWGSFGQKLGADLGESSGLVMGRKRGRFRAIVEMVLGAIYNGKEWVKGWI